MDCERLVYIKALHPVTSLHPRATPAHLPVSLLLSLSLHTLRLCPLSLWCVSMQLAASFLSLVLLLYTVKAAAVPAVEERSLAHADRERNKERILRVVSSLLDGVDSNMLGVDMTPEGMEEPQESHLEERAIYNRLSQLPQRDRKAPCKNFFWKTFTSC
ncbi:cortistatin isoform X1 [Brienomyrus brachyistius]|uniref:cortistatin isoform X1 n=2 Tax=Brienomyrus brachyistius TaxID=42636 RepID=UPI0020B26847|nr:cortistatin isoform X1 [Brienomyrus brachyistius]